MKKALRFWSGALLSVATFLHNTPTSAAVLKFDELTPGMDHFAVTNGYAGLDWSNFRVLNSMNQGFRTGYRLGTISRDNVIFNAFGDPAEISSAQSFDLYSAYVTAAVVDSLEIRALGFAGGQLVFDTTHILSVTSPTFIQLNYLGVDRVRFQTVSDSPVAIDNLRITLPGDGRVDPEDKEESNVDPETPANPSVTIGPLEVTAPGESVLAPPSIPGLPSQSVIHHYLIDQARREVGSAALPNVIEDWNDHTVFQLTVSAPPGKKFQITIPPGTSAGFSGFLIWETGDRGGFSATGPITVQFADLEGYPPDFSESDAVLSDSHGFFGVFDLESTRIVGDLAFTSMTITGTVSPQVTTYGTRTYVAHGESFLSIYHTMPGPTVAIVNSDTIVAPPTVPNIGFDHKANSDLVLTFTGKLQFSPSPAGPFEDVPGNPQGSYAVPRGTPQFFRVRK